MIAIFIFFLFCSTVQADAWPAEPWTSGVNLTSLDDEFQADMSGAFWNPETRVLWVCQNGLAKVWALVEDGAGSFMVRTDVSSNRFEWDLGSQDLEDLTQVNLSEDTVYILNESAGVIQSFDLSLPGSQPLIRSWNVSAHLPVYSGGSGPEGICFIPDDWLECRQFQDGNGTLYQSQKGMGGIMLVAHQVQGQVYAFDLNPLTDNDYLFIGQYDSSQNESCSLSFDRNLGLLYIWHNISANYLEVSDLTSSPLGGSIRGLRTIVEFEGPRTGNLEGFTAAPQSGEGYESWCFLMLDGGMSDSVRWFQSYHLPDTAPPIFQGLTPRIVSTGVSECICAIALNEAGKGYDVVVLHGADTPDYKKVRGGKDASGAAPVFAGMISVDIPDTEISQTITGLSPGTEYDIHFVAEDTYGILQTTVQSLSFTTVTLTPTPSGSPTTAESPTGTVTQSPSGSPTLTVTATPSVSPASTDPPVLPATSQGNLTCVMIVLSILLWQRLVGNAR